MNCKLKEAEIETVLEIISGRSINDLMIDDNGYIPENLNALVMGPNLQYLTLNFCQLTDENVKNLAEALNIPHSVLLMLNLASNYITDEGMHHLIKMLRLNRSLVILNVANNALTDKSCSYLSEALQKFELTHEEIVVRRIETYNRLHTVKELVR